MVRIFIDPGHGGSDAGASGNGLTEKDLTLNIALTLDDVLNEQYDDVTTRLSRSTDTTVSLEERTNRANEWNADFFLSIHVNAGGGEGFESYIWNGNFTNKEETRRIRRTIHDTIVEQINWRDRGKKEANFHVLRQTSMPAVLTENGFIDNPEEAEQMRSEEWISSVARAHAEGIAEAFGIEESTESDPTPNTFYRVITGSFQTEANAKQRRYVLSKHGYDSFITEFHDGDSVYYRVVTGSFRNRDNAENRQNELRNIGFESFIVSFET
ncbi:N-acetylmuramoyl-L-alanine amidase [Natronobacillus azotifigens]|uniref:N-acetylmuramoyl-L-alanine amidase n=1 Tax=Natronobacillus azotifigens TaxID=472978 RepID=A0A9J6RAV4_9BACI|nr:N-acetylmuramoyl-L-alanine amidase [Natronobacillus azotifigens]MCZ0702671.1 N-acetylmuramoyl-L-alanine amidase [Natronobacillus azotifigens]